MTETRGDPELMEEPTEGQAIVDNHGILIAVFYLFLPSSSSLQKKDGQGEHGPETKRVHDSSTLGCKEAAIMGCAIGTHEHCADTTFARSMEPDHDVRECFDVYSTVPAEPREGSGGNVVA